MPCLILAAISWDNVTQNDGLSIAITGITIVFIALVLITIFLYQLPKLVAIANRVFPEPEHSSTGSQSTTSSVSNDEDLIAAAIAVAHHTHQNS